MGPKKRASTDTDDAGAVPPAAADGDGAGASPKKKRGEKGSEKAKPAAKAPAEKTVIPKAELKKPSPPPAGARLFKIISWNVTTLRSLVNKNPQLLATLFQQERPDVVVLQETKLNEVDHAEYEEKIAKLVPGYKLYWNSCSLPGSKSYSGTVAMVRTASASAVASGEGKAQGTLHHFFAKGAKAGKGKKQAEEEKPAKEASAAADGESQSGGAASGGVAGDAKEPKVTLDLPTLLSSDGATACEVNQEGRTITLEYPEFWVVATYVPNSGDKLQRLDFRTQVWDKRLQEYLKSLEASGKPVLWCGDLNVCHLDEDIWNVGAKHLEKSAGTTKAERQSFADGLAQGDFVDCFREIHGKEASGWFTYWSVRAGNVPWNRGLRLDYFVASQSLVQGKEGEAKVVDSQVLSEFVALDHAAISLTVALPS